MIILYINKSIYSETYRNGHLRTADEIAEHVRYPEVLLATGNVIAYTGV